MFSLKKIIIPLSLFFISVNYFAQNNGDFENWTSFGTYEDPTNWQSFNILSLFAGNPITATKVSGVDKYSGNYALKITSKYFPVKIISNFPDTVGFAFNGKITFSPPSYEIGSPYTSRPQKLTFYAKYIPVGVDYGYSGLILYRNLPTGRDTIGYGTLVIPSNPTYNLYTINIIYKSNAIPDSANIYFQASNSTNGNRVGSSLYLDEVKFVDYVGVKKNNAATNNVKLYPNPATEAITIYTEIEEAEKVEIINYLGVTIAFYNLKNFSTKINVTDFNNGIYFYKILDKKNNILNYGKFIVKK